MAADVDSETTKAELLDASRKLREAHGAIGCFLDQSSDDMVHWIERSGRDESLFSLHAAPRRDRKETPRRGWLFRAVQRSRSAVQARSPFRCPRSFGAP